MKRRFQWLRTCFFKIHSVPSGSDAAVPAARLLGGESLSGGERGETRAGWDWIQSIERT